MKKMLSILLVFSIMLTGCRVSPADSGSSSQPISSQEQSGTISEAQTSQEQSSDEPQPSESETSDETSAPDTSAPSDDPTEVPQFTGMDDPSLLDYLEDEIYLELIDEFDSDDFFIENIEAVYLSKEYLEELEFNSKSNLYFGYSLAELDELFEGERYVFIPDEDGNTTVKAFEQLDDTYEKAIIKGAIGVGIIVVCVVVSVAAGAMGGPAQAVSAIFSFAAKGAVKGAAIGGLVSAASAAIVTGIQTGNVDEVLKSAAAAGSDGFMWGAIIGALEGGIGEAVKLKGATMNGLTMNEAARIQRESKYPLEIIKQLKSYDEYKILKDAGLTGEMVDKNLALIRKIDLDFVKDGTTNLEKMLNGYAPVDPNGIPYELHHIGQKANGTLAILTKEEHMGGGNNGILHILDKAFKSEVHGTTEADAAWKATREAFWKAYAAMVA